MNTLRVLVVATLFLFLTVSANAKIIHNDRGGLIIDYVHEVGRLTRKGEPVRIDGLCQSACTLYLAVPGSCVTARSQLSFHRSSGPPEAKKLLPLMDKYVMAMYPPKVRAWIKSKGGLTSRLIYLQGKELIGKVRICK